MDVARRKDSVRRVVLSRRGRLGGDAREAAGARAAERLFALEAVAAARTLIAFASFGSEIPTDALVERALEEGRAVLLPYVAGPGELRAARVRSIEDVAPGWRGIREPLAREPLDPGTADVAIVPGVAFDARGARLGYGGGFYDRFLASLPRRIQRVGFALDVQVVEDVPEEAGDERVDWIVTEERAIRCD